MDYSIEETITYTDGKGHLGNCIMNKIFVKHNQSCGTCGKLYNETR